ncbi:MAG TPA: SpoIIE family protein phosphatase [Conexibacter sp.]|nr:SpoIIE family protein phosphatase [Conexibacter sp.]
MPNLPDVGVSRAEGDDAHQLRSLQRVTDAALASLSEEQLLRELLLRITDILGTDTAAILLLDDAGELLHARAAKGIEEEVKQGVKIPVGRGFAGRIAASKRPLAIEDVDHADVLNPILREKGIHSLLGVPLLVEGRVLGVLHVGSLTHRIFTPEETGLLQLAADRAAIAIEHARLYAQRELAASLQRRLLPTDLSGIGGLELASRYLPASRESLGGDWYDAFLLGRGRIALAIGDVVGHGVEAAAVMAQLRTALRAYAVEGHASGEVVELVNQLMCDLGPRAMTTLAYVVLDPEAEDAELVVAGHPPPLLMAPGDAPSFVAAQGGMPLGVSTIARYPTEHFAVSPGSTVVLYTDGLVERRRESIDVGLERLRAIAREPTSVEGLCKRAIEQLVPDEPHDDVALIAARIPPPSERLHEHLPADRAVLASVRRTLRRWLRARGANEAEAYDIVVACQEACANAVEHAYRPGRHAFELEAECEAGVVRLTVRDHGRWRPPRGTHRGRGMLMMEGLMDVVDVVRGDEGTVVVLERALEEPGA